MNPFNILNGAGGGAGGFQGSSESSSDGRSGSAGGGSTGNKIFNLGATNPNTAAGVISNPMVLVALVAGVYLVAKR